jgi:hypothetical protein
MNQWKFRALRAVAPWFTHRFKKRFSGMFSPVGWRLTVLNIKTLEALPLVETKSVDDEVAWVDNETVMYALPDSGPPPAVTNVWSVSAQGAGQPKILLSKAYSPVMISK